MSLELDRQQGHIELIVLKILLMGQLCQLWVYLTNKYAEGYPKEILWGCQYVILLRLLQ